MTTIVFPAIAIWNSIKSQRPRNTAWKENQDQGSMNFLRVLVDPSNPTVDIVAVHGLNPLDHPSHAETTWTATDKLWLKDFLPKRVPHARIFIFGYNSNVAFGSAAAGLREHAENLLNLLEESRSTDPERPLMFICHSLGGLLVKRALVHSNNNITYQAIRKSTFGIAFFGTPHRGGHHARIGDVVAKVARSISGSPSNNFMNALKEGSCFLDIISDDFRQLLEDFQILTFYETQPLGLLGIIVDRKSAILGLPSSRERLIPLDADHKNICKFDNDRDPKYRQVEDNIVRMVNNSSINHRLRENASHSAGEYNSTLQAGYNNQSKIDGNANKTRQFGNGNESKTIGNENTTMQIAIGAIDLGFYTDMFKPFGWLDL